MFSTAWMIVPSLHAGGSFHLADRHRSNEILHLLLTNSVSTLEILRIHAQNELGFCIRHQYPERRVHPDEKAFHWRIDSLHGPRDGVRDSPHPGLWKHSLHGDTFTNIARLPQCRSSHTNGSGRSSRSGCGDHPMTSLKGRVVSQSCLGTWKYLTVSNLPGSVPCTSYRHSYFPYLHGQQRVSSHLLAASLWFACAPLFSTVFAATTSPASVSATTPRLKQLTRSVAVVARSPQLAQVVQVSVTTSVVAAPPDSAGDPCRTSQRQQNGKDAFGITLFWFKMRTSWCWDYRTVTGHTTRIYCAVTGPGAVFGWAYVSNSGIYFNCYVAYGSTRDCSGNHEEATASFPECRDPADLPAAYR